MMRNISQTSFMLSKWSRRSPRTCIDPDDAPALQLAQAGADVGARHAERRGDLLGVERLRREEQQRVDLRHRAVDAPPRAHLAPVEDELLLDRRQFRWLRSVISV